MKSKSFAQILEERLEKVDSQPAKTSVRFTSPYVDGTLFQHFNSVTANPAVGQKLPLFTQWNYPASSPQEEASIEGFSLEELSENEISAWTRLQSGLGESLTSFSRSQLKTIFRRQARRLHPDKNPLWRTEEYTFLNLKEDYKTLESTITELEKKVA